MKTPFLGCAYYPEDWADDQLSYDIRMMKAAGITSGGRDWMDAEQALLALEEGAPRAAAQQEEDRVAEEKAKRTEHLLSYIMLGIAVVILVLIIAIAFKACAIFAPPETQKTTTRAVTVPPNRTSAQTEEGTQTKSSYKSSIFSTVPKELIKLYNL